MTNKKASISRNRAIFNCILAGVLASFVLTAVAAFIFIHKFPT